MRKVVVPLVPVLCVCLLLAQLHAQTAREIADKTFPSVVLLVMQDPNGQPISLGSGFFIESDIVATNLHVIEKAARGYAKIVGQETKHDVIGCVGFDVARDLALLKIRGAEAPVVRLADSNEVAVGDQVYVVGNPRGLEGTFSSGIVSGVRRFGEDSLLQITAPISPGSSGGPVLDSFGRVVGIPVGTFKVGENLNFSVPATYLKLLMEAKTPLKPLPIRTASSRKSPVLDRGAKGVVGTHFRWGLELVEGPAILLKEIEFTLSIRNELPEPVRNVRYLVVFYDRYNKPVEVYDSHDRFDSGNDPGMVPAGLAKRVTGSVNRTVRHLTERVDIRILDFEFVE